MSRYLIDEFGISDDLALLIEQGPRSGQTHKVTVDIPPTATQEQTQAFAMNALCFGWMFHIDWEGSMITLYQSKGYSA